MRQCLTYLNTKVNDMRQRKEKKSIQVDVIFIPQKAEKWKADLKKLLRNKEDYTINWRHIGTGDKVENKWIVACEDNAGLIDNLKLSLPETELPGMIMMIGKQFNEELEDAIKISFRSMHIRYITRADFPDDIYRAERAVKAFIEVQVDLILIQQEAGTWKADIKEMLEKIDGYIIEERHIGFRDEVKNKWIVVCDDSEGLIVDLQHWIPETELPGMVIRIGKEKQEGRKEDVLKHRFPDTRLRYITRADFPYDTYRARKAVKALIDDDSKNADFNKYVLDICSGREEKVLQDEKTILDDSCFQESLETYEVGDESSEKETVLNDDVFDPRETCLQDSKNQDELLVEDESSEKETVLHVNDDVCDPRETYLRQFKNQDELLDESPEKKNIIKDDVCKARDKCLRESENQNKLEVEFEENRKIESKVEKVPTLDESMSPHIERQVYIKTHPGLPKRALSDFINRNMPCIKPIWKTEEETVDEGSLCIVVCFTFSRLLDDISAVIKITPKGCTNMLVVIQNCREGNLPGPMLKHNPDKGFADFTNMLYGDGKCYDCKINSEAKLKIESFIESN